METMTWDDVKAFTPRSTPGSTEELDWPNKDSFLVKLWEVLNPIPSTPVDAALTLAGGPAAKVVGGAAGVLKYLPWEKVASRLPDLSQYTDDMKRQFELIMRRSAQTGDEHAVMGVQTPTRLPRKYSEGTPDSVYISPPDAWYSHRRVAETPAAYTAHTHPSVVRPAAGEVDVGNPFFSLSDIRTNMAEPQFYRNSSNTLVASPTDVRGNMEHVVLSPQGYSWLSFLDPVNKKHLPLRAYDGVPGNNYEAAQDMLARLIYGAKKDRWDLQLGFDPARYGVKP